MEAPKREGDRGWAVLRSPLALRIYLAGLAQFAAVAVGFAVLLGLTRPPGGGPLDDQARYITGTLAGVLGDPVAFEREVSRLRFELRARVTVVDPDGVVIARTAPPGSPRCRVFTEPGAHGDDFCVPKPLRFPDGRVGTVEFLARGRPPFVGWRVVVIVLIVVGVSSWLLARTLTRPLRQLSDAARALGGGDLGARVGLRRGDELGEVAVAFDEMAERVAALLRSEKELLANISHELRTPLSRIRVALDLAAEGDAEMARESLADIAGDLDELERLISDVLTAARLDLGDGSAPAGTPPLRRERLDVGELLAQAASRFRAAHPERPLEIDVPGRLPAVEGDRVLLRRVVDNLLENAHKYTERPGVAVRLVASEREGVEIEVIDQGIGIGADDLPRVFRPFFRADRSRTRATGGLGLGLALARRIVDAHGGRISLESRLDQGTCARVWLPVSPG